MEKEESSLSLWPLLLCCCISSSLRRKKPEEKVQSIFHIIDFLRPSRKAFFTFPGSKYLTMNKIYITLPPLLSLFFWPMLSGMTNNSKVKKCLIVGTHLPNGKVHQGEGREQGKKKNHPERAALWNRH